MAMWNMHKRFADSCDVFNTGAAHSVGRLGP